MNNYINTEYGNLSELAHKKQISYQNSAPFPSIYFKNFFNSDMLDKVLSEFPDLSRSDTIKFDDNAQKKLAGKGESLFGDETLKFMHFLNSEPFLKFIQEMTGIEETLLGDPYFSGGGLHEIKKGGLLKIHADFNKHPLTKLDRRINVLIYLNKNWK